MTSKTKSKATRKKTGKKATGTRKTATRKASPKKGKAVPAGHAVLEPARRRAQPRSSPAAAAAPRELDVAVLDGPALIISDEDVVAETVDAPPDVDPAVPACPLVRQDHDDHTHGVDLSGFAEALRVPEFRRLRRAASAARVWVLHRPLAAVAAGFLCGFLIGRLSALMF